MKYAIIDEETGATVRYGDAPEDVVNDQPVNEGERIVIPDADVDLSASKLNVATGEWEPFDPTDTPLQREIAAQMASAAELRRRLSGAFTSSAAGKLVRYTVDRLRFLEVAQCGGLLLCNGTLIMHTPEQGKQLLTDFIAWRDGIEQAMVLQKQNP